VTNHKSVRHTARENTETGLQGIGYRKGLPSTPMNTSEWSRADQQLTEWRNLARSKELLHDTAAKGYGWWHYVIGVPVVILTGIVGTSAFANLKNGLTPQAQLMLGSLSLAATGLSGLQIFLRFSERAEHHRVAANKYETIRRDIEAAQSIPPESRKEIERLLLGVKTGLNDATGQAPTLPWWTSLRVARKSQISGRDPAPPAPS
jgi:hypothetical protein